MEYKIAPKTHGMQDDHEGFRPDFWQGETGECAIHAQFRILQDYGYRGTVDDLRQEAIEHGWFDPDTGTPSADIGKLLELHNVPCDMYFEANRYNLLNELAQGKRVIVTVDSSELWHKNTILEKSWENLKDLFPGGADHAVVVSGINTEDPNNIQVVLTDSGDGHRTISYPIEQFEDAWRDGHCQMIVTQTPPPPEYALGRLMDKLPWMWDMSNFDYQLGHVAKIGGHSFEDWQELHINELDDCSSVPMDDSFWGREVLMAGGSDTATETSELYAIPNGQEDIVPPTGFHIEEGNDGSESETDCVDINFVADACDNNDSLLHIDDTSHCSDVNA